jgi:hypothetical protein
MLWPLELLYGRAHKAMFLLKLEIELGPSGVDY